MALKYAHHCVSGPPSTLRNCLVVNQTIDSLLVRCEQGYDGGLAQTFHLEVYASSDEHLTTNISTDESPVFLVTDLQMDTSYILVLYAANAKGRSNSVAIVAATLLPAERRTGKISNYTNLLNSNINMHSYPKWWEKNSYLN